MSESKRSARRTPADQHVTVYLGEQGRQELARCQQLLAVTAPYGRQPSAGLALRLALRRLLLGLLGEQADWSVPADPIAEEYLALVGTEFRLGEIPVQAEVSRAASRITARKRSKGPAPLKGGLE